MNYAVISILVAALVGLELMWRRRYKRLLEERRYELQTLETAQKRHYDESAQIAAEHHALFNSMSEGALILDQAGRVHLVTRPLQEFFGLKTDVRGQTIMETFRLQELAEITKRLPQERTVQGH